MEKVKQILESLNKAVVDDIKIYDMHEITPFFDYSIISSASSSRQAMAALDYVVNDQEKLGHMVKKTANSSDSTWFLLDLGDVVVHIFVGEDRERYSLDKMYNKGLIKEGEDL